MNHKPKPSVSFIIPCHNEAGNIAPVIDAIRQAVSGLTFTFRFILVNDGSTDRTADALTVARQSDSTMKIVTLRRNFGKEIALAAGLSYDESDASIMIDADGQHPAELLPKMLDAWQAGAQVVTGVRARDAHDGITKRIGSKLFYRLYRRLTGIDMKPGATDFRLIDRQVRTEFLRLTERNRMTRALIDWLGFTQIYLPFKASDRQSGAAGYTVPKLLKLALDSFVSESLKPLFISFYAGLVIMPLAVLLGIFCLVEMLVGDPLSLNITGTAYLVLLALFLLGLVLISQGITALYLSHIHTETQNRPLFLVDTQHSHLD